MEIKNLYVVDFVIIDKLFKEMTLTLNRSCYKNDIIMKNVEYFFMNFY